MNRQFLISILLLLTLIAEAYSQGITNDGALITITSNSVVTVDGDGNGSYLNLTSGNDGAIDIDGRMIIKGNWTNNASNNVFINRDGDGLVEFTANVNQSINGSSKTIFEDLTINNTIASGTAVTLNIDAEVSSTCRLDDGVVSTGSNFFILSSDNTAELASYSEISFIDGNLRRYIATNTDTYVFPLGKGTATTDYYRADLLNGSLNGISYLDSHFGDLVNHNDADLNVTEEGTDYTSMATEGVWFFDPDIAPSGGDYDLRLHITNFTGLVDNQFAILKRPTAAADASEWVCTPCGFGDPGINTTNGAGRLVSDGYALRLGFSSFSQFGIGTQDGILPVELISFTAYSIENIVLCKWQTASEINNDHFTVERSADLTNIETVGTVPGAGNSSVVLNYELTDTRPLPGTSYYRLKQTDFDGSVSYSGWVAVSFNPDRYEENSLTEKNEAKTKIVKIYPNPSHSYTLLEFTSAKEQLFVCEIYDLSMKKIFETEHFATNGTNYLRLDIRNLRKGYYIVILQNDYSKDKCKLIKY